jgi:tetratricopeptide (TPR) repeat protein
LTQIKSKRISKTEALKRLWITILVSVLFGMATAQSFIPKAPDSLLSAVRTSTGIKKVDALNQLAKQTIQFSTSEAVPIIKEALVLAESFHYQKGNSNALENLALLVFKRGDYNKGIKLMNYAAHTYKINNYQEDYINCLILEAGYYEFVNDNEKIVNTYLEAIITSKKIGRLDLESKADSYLGQYFLKLGDKSNALAYLSKAMINGKKSKNTIAIGNAIYAMALSFGSDKQYEKALRYLRVALEKVSSSNEILSSKTIYSKMGDFFLESNQNDSAFIYYNKVLKIASVSFDIGSMATTYTRIAHIFEQKQELDSSLKYQMLALTLRRTQGNLTLTGSSLTNIGTVYAKMHDYDRALNYYNQGLAIAKQTGYLNYIQFSYQRLYDLYFSQKNYKKAIDYNLLLSAINDSIINTETRQKFIRIQARYESAQKQKAIEFLTKENDIQKLKINQTRLLIYILGTLLILSIAIGILLNIQAKLNARYRQMESEQKLLRSQMNPQFIFNALVSIQGFIFNNESDIAAKYLTRFAKLIRLVLSNSREEYVSLRREIDMLENYLALQEMRFEKKFEYTFIVDPSLDPEFIKIPPMLAQPFVESAIEQGILGMDKPGFIEVSILEKDHSLIIKVLDNGNRRENNKVQDVISGDPDKSSALQITKERIRHLNHNQASKITLNINELKDENNQSKGTLAILIIPEKRLVPASTRK